LKRRSGVIIRREQGEEADADNNLRLQNVHLFKTGSAIGKIAKAARSDAADLAAAAKSD
jgi:hypothetical protein